MAKPSSGKKHKPADTLPSKTDILEFIQSYHGKAGKREIARAFNVKGGARIGLKNLLKEMAEEGLIAGSKKRLTEPGKLPSVSVLEISGRDEHGDFYAVPLTWDEDEHGARPKVLIAPTGSRQRKSPVAGIGNRVLARITRRAGDVEDGFAYSATVIKILDKTKGQFLGIVRKLETGGGVIVPVDKKNMKEWHVSRHEIGDAGDGELVRFEPLKSGRFGPPGARVIDCLGNPSDQRMVSLIAVHRHGIPERFPDIIDADLQKLTPPSLEGRDDLRDIPLLTIDPPDARDHDDAVWATRDDAPNNEGGFVVIVAIADVAHYVRPGSNLDKEALKRGNSVYFPDRVIPMLPERISNDLCSLREKEERPCLAVRMVFDKNGHKKSHKFMRAIMRSAAKLSYLEAQQAIDGNPCEKAEPLLDVALRPLWEAYNALSKARQARGPLELDLPERKIKLDENGRVAQIIIPERLDAHRLIEEFMIQANVAAAEALEAKRSPVMYRIHEAPSEEKLNALRDFMATLEINVKADGGLRPAHFNGILGKMKDTPFSDLVNEVILRSQAQAEYNPFNAGHFGLNLRRYAHFTSPIRRYADLIIHRALISAYKLGDDGITDDQIDHLEEIGETISDTERRAMTAERETVDRLIAYHLASRIGAKFSARISGTTKSGLFVRLDDTGADGFIPASTLGADYFYHDETHHALVGQDTGETFRLGDQVEVRLIEAVPTAGALRFEMLSTGKREKRPPARRKKFVKQGRKPQKRRR